MRGRKGREGERERDRKRETFQYGIDREGDGEKKIQTLSAIVLRD